MTHPDPKPAPDSKPDFKPDSEPESQPGLDAAPQARAATHAGAQPPPGDADPTPSTADEQAAQTASRKLAASRKMLRLTIAFAGFVVGLVIGPYAEELITRSHPGFFGPDNQQVIDDQKANFAHLEAKLKELQHVAGDDPKAQALIEQLKAALREQKALAEKKNELFKETEVQNRVLADRLREQQGTGAAIDFWLKVGESVTLVDPDISFAVLGIYTNDTQIRANLSGQDRRIAVGDPLVFDTSKGKHAVIFRQARRESDARYGFDLVKTDRLASAPEPE